MRMSTPDAIRAAGTRLNTSIDTLRAWLGPTRSNLLRVIAREMEAGPVLTSERTADESTDEISPSIGPLLRPTWAEVDEARVQYDSDAKRLRFWRWWFIGMFTFYTTLVGILLLRIFLG